MLKLLWAKPNAKIHRGNNKKQTRGGENDVELNEEVETGRLPPESPAYITTLHMTTAILRRMTLGATGNKPKCDRTHSVACLVGNSPSEGGENSVVISNIADE